VFPRHLERDLDGAGAGQQPRAGERDEILERPPAAVRPDVGRAAQIADRQLAPDLLADLPRGERQKHFVLGAGLGEDALDIRMDGEADALDALALDLVAQGEDRPELPDVEARDRRRGRHLVGSRAAPAAEADARLTLAQRDVDMA